MKPLDLSWIPPQDRRRVAASFRRAARVADQQGRAAARDGRLYFAQLLDEMDRAHLPEHVREDVAGDDQPCVRGHRLHASEGAFA